jgi:hypothetical protein
LERTEGTPQESCGDGVGLASCPSSVPPPSTPHLMWNSELRRRGNRETRGGSQEFELKLGVNEIADETARFYGAPSTSIRLLSDLTARESFRTLSS